MRSISLLVFATACTATASATEGPLPMPPMPVTVAVVTARPIDAADELTGHIEARHRLDVRPRVAGHVTAVHYTEGAEVAAGALLFTIDPRPYQATLARAQAEVARAEARAELARIELARTDKLVASAAVPASERDANAAAARGAEAEVAAARAAAQLARLDVEFTAVRAPFAGKTGIAQVTVGDYVAPATAMTSLASLDPVDVYFTGDERTFLRLNTRSGSAAAPVSIGLADETGFPHAGTLDFVDNRLDAATATIRLRATVPNPDHRLVPGLYARVHLLEGARAPGIAIDDKAILTDQDRRYVYVVVGGAIARRDLTLGAIAGGRRIVTKGLAPGDHLVVGNLQKIGPGSPVAETVIP